MLGAFHFATLIFAGSVNSIYLMNIRTGFGVDFHQLVPGREFWLGGVKVEFEKGAMGHSDADVLLHAICDALLGAACLGDIGIHFPDTDNTYKNVDSKTLLRKTYALLMQEGYTLVNIDSTICLQSPKISKYVPHMQEAIAGILSLGIKDVSIKATTTERMGFVGREEGIIAYASVLIRRD